VGGAAFLGYLALSFLFFGVRVVAHPEQDYVGGLAADPQIFIWAFAWWPHAILHGETPFYTHAIWAPDGFNLAWTTTIPGLAVAFAPLTLLFGPVLAYNAASILMPALTAWTAFLLCRHITRATWPSLAGGYVFGFSTYMLGGEIDHMHTTSVFLVPVAALLVLRFLDGELGRVAFLCLFAALVAAELSFSTEVLFTMSLALACALVLAFALVPAARTRLLALVLPLAGAYGLAAAVAAPFVYYVLTGSAAKPLPGPEDFVADALNFVVPTHMIAAGWWAGSLGAHFPGNDAERGTYLGLPLLVIVGWFALRRARTPSGRFLLAAFALAAVASLGSWLTVYGHRVLTLPWVHLASRPLFEHVMPARLSMYTSLAAAVMLALWAAASRPAWLRVGLPALAVLAIAPNVTLAAWARSPHVPAFFTTGLHETCLRRGENVLIFPYGPRGDSMLWQAESGFWFRQAGGYVSPKVPDSFTSPPAIAHVTTADNPFELTLPAILELARLKGVSSILVGAAGPDPLRATLAPLGPPGRAGGTLVYRVPGGAGGRAEC
jgi:hypothetical protein